MSAAQRARYSPYVKEQVRKRYPLCRTTADKEALASELGIGSVSKLYNLASRLEAAGQDVEPGEHPEAHSSVRLQERENPDSIKFTRNNDRYLKSEFGRRSIEDISYHLNHSETAVLYRARHLGLRKAVKYWKASKVARWFGMSEKEFHSLSSQGIDIHPLADRRGKVQLELVSTTSLARWLDKKKNITELHKRGADEFFIREIQESVADILAHQNEFESCKFLSHGHVCQNPFADSWGLFCTNNEKYNAGEDPHCAVRTLHIEDLYPESN